MKRQSYYLICIALCCTATFAQAQTCPPFDGRIFLNSVEYNLAGEPLAVIWGYELNASNPVTEPSGGRCNFFLPVTFRKGMLSTFQPGLHERAFRIELGAGETLLFWFLGDQSVQMDLSTARPSSPLAPLPSLPAAVVALPYAQQLEAVGGKAGLTWSVLAPLPDGITLSSDGKLSGTPAKAGEFTVRVRVSDGATTIARAYALTIGETLAIDDAASTRAPGFTPQFRLVSAAANSVNATAQCDAREFVVAGGGACNVPNNSLLRGVLSSSQPAANGWAVKCGLGAATAIAVCSLR